MFSCIVLLFNYAFCCMEMYNGVSYYVVYMLLSVYTYCLVMYYFVFHNLISCVVLYYIILYYIIFYSIIVYCDLMCWYVFYYIIVYCTTLYCEPRSAPIQQRCLSTTAQHGNVTPYVT